MKKNSPGIAWSAGKRAIRSMTTLETRMHQMVLNPKPMPIAITATMIRRALMAM